MKRKYLNPFYNVRIILLVGFIILSSCRERDLSVNDLGQPVPILNCILNAGEIAKAQFSFSVPIGPVTSELVVEQNAKILLYEDGELFDSLVYDFTENLYIGQNVVNNDATYEIELKYDDVYLTGKTHVPVPAELVLRDTLYDTSKGTANIKFVANIEIQNIGKAYGFNLPYRTSSYRKYQNGFVLSIEDVVNLSFDKQNEFSFAGKSFRLLETNEISNGSIITTRISQQVNRPGASNPFYDSTLVFIESLSEEYYKYITMPEAAFLGNHGPMEDIPVTYTNISGGAGIFASSAKANIWLIHFFNL